MNSEIASIDYGWTRNEDARQTQIRRLARLAFPSYRGRKFKFAFSDSYQMQNYWDGGTRYYAVAINLRTNEISRPSGDTTNPFKSPANAEIKIPEGFAIIEHCIFCGKSLGIRLILPPLQAIPDVKGVQS